MELPCSHLSGKNTGAGGLWSTDSEPGEPVSTLQGVSAKGGQIG